MDRDICASVYRVGVMISIRKHQISYVATALILATLLIWKLESFSMALALEIMVIAVSAQKIRWVFLYFMDVRSMPGKYRVAFEIWASLVFAIICVAVIL